MPWYKSGTVSVTQNSNAVIGTGTAFIANSRVGDAFRGPDGAWYEVTNIASDTALSISPNYQGAANATGIYALVPMQGYVKDSADTLRALVNTYGAKLAALGTTGNYDTLPVAKGGTGGTDQAGARTGLGLGSISTEDIAPVAKGGTGGTDQASARAGLGLGSLALESVAPVAKGGTGGTTPATARTGLGLKAAAVADILGTVSQSGGVPTGAIIETGSNANGTYVKYADGTMICHRRLSITTPIPNTNGPLFFASISAVSYAASFVGPTPTCQLNSEDNNGLTWATFGSGVTLTVFPSFFIMAPVSVVSRGYTINMVAIGRWF